uniref:Transmembrane protein n=1 Tax=Romanomermis culicivorax TaxID=13658 RepID=A0A915JAC7_ROMCU
MFRKLFASCRSGRGNVLGLVLPEEDFFGSKMSLEYCVDMRPLLFHFVGFRALFVVITFCPLARSHWRSAFINITCPAFFLGDYYLL